MTPPIDVPWPPINFVADSTTMSAPHSMGRQRIGVAEVLSIISGTPCSWAMLASRLNVGDVEFGIAQGLSVDSPRFPVDGRPQAVKIVGIDKAYGDAQPRQRVVEQVVGAAIERGGGDDLVSGAGQRGNGQGFGGLAGGGGQRGRSPFERGHPLLEDIRRRVHDAGVDVAEFLQGKEPGGMIGVLEDVGGGLVDGNGARSGRGIGLLPGMHGKGCEMLLLASDICLLL